ncbi:RNA 2'-phosphotransferase [Curtobacterium sp. NPDC098951]|uniref:RNA 2'-phosphotransferase n=1 Tax=Curtobacterium sp. NPDC098951 TaxID=3363974 RepID=UPI0038286742
MSKVTPLVVAQMVGHNSPEEAVLRLRGRFERQMPELAALAVRAGLQVSDQFSQWVDRVGIETVGGWLDIATDPALLASRWNESKHSPLPALAMLVMESRLCTVGAAIGSYFRSGGSSYAEELIEARWLIADALRRHASSIRFSEPVILVRVSELAASVYESLRPFTKASRANRDKFHIQRQVARQAIVAARMSSGRLEKLQEALEHLKGMPEAPTDISTAVLRIEASIELYHLTGERAYLVEAMRFAQTRDVPNDDWPAWHLINAEIWLNLADFATERARVQFLSRADEALRSVENQELELAYEIRCAMDRALQIHLSLPTSKSSTVRGVRLPFALRAPHQLPEVIYTAAPELIAALRPAAERGQYQYREFLAELQSRVARAGGATNGQMLLEDAVRLRRPVGVKDALAGTRDLLAQAQDLLLLSALRQSSQLRAEGLEILLKLHRRDPNSSEPLVLLANDLEARGGISLKIPYVREELLHHIQRGNFTEVFELAASCAFNNPGLRVSGLGGRGETYTVDDFSGITGQTFVFKRTSAAALERDELRAKAISARVAADQLKYYDVIEHIGVIPIEDSASQSSLISVRRYARGRTLRLALSEAPSVERVGLLERAAVFLGLIHGWERGTSIDVASPRNQLKEKEVGRWLRKLVGQTEKLRMFNDWWALVQGVPAVPRRDAHTLNWLVNDDQKVFAADLEATGVRPLGYELSQLVDDHPVLAPEDWEARLSILTAYLSSAGLPVTSEVELSYRASTAARAVGILTDSHSTDTERNHAFQLLSHLAASPVNIQLQLWCKEVLESWRVKTGLSDPTRLTAIQPNDRVRISKAMSFHLRHDPTAQTTRGGWMFVEDLADVMREHGHNVTPQQLLVVAGALGEPRFELDGDEVRAAYGHSIARRADYEVATPPAWLYHATPASNFGSIFEGRGGLRPMGREFAHLSTNPMRALTTAQRHAKDVLLLRVAGRDVPGLVRAAEDTWLAPLVGAEALEVVTAVGAAELERA